MFLFFTFLGETQVHIFEGHDHNIWGLENDALHNVLFPGAYGELWALSVGCIQHQVTLAERELFTLRKHVKYTPSPVYLQKIL